MTFLELLQHLEQRLGNQHLPLNPKATEFKKIFEGSPVHHDLMRGLVEAIYVANGCRQLTDTVDKEICFSAIGPLRRDTLKTATADVDVYRLLDEFCHALSDIFSDGGKNSGKEEVKASQAEIISIDSARRRK
jgi:hypothetical protein